MPRVKQFDRTEVLEKALELFWRKGFHATSMQELVSFLGISRASLYDTFGSKQDLFLESLAKYRTNNEVRMGKLMEREIPSKEFIAIFLQKAIDESIDDEHQKGCFYVNCAVELASQDEVIAKLVKENMERNEQFFSQLIQKGQENGEISTSKDATALGRFFFSTLSGLKVMAKTTKDISVLLDVKKVALSVLD